MANVHRKTEDQGTIEISLALMRRLTRFLVSLTNDEDVTFSSRVLERLTRGCVETLRESETRVVYDLVAAMREPVAAPSSSLSLSARLRAAAAQPCACGDDLLTAAVSQ